MSLGPNELKISKPGDLFPRASDITSVIVGIRFCIYNFNTVSLKTVTVLCKTLHTWKQRLFLDVEYKVKCVIVKTQVLWYRKKHFSILRYTDVTWAPWCLTSRAITLSGHMFVAAYFKVNINAPHYCSFVRGIHQWLVDSPQKGPVMQKLFPCHDIIIRYLPI